jgi:mitochondrial import inner membrane translocase subunit TIM22
MGFGLGVLLSPLDTATLQPEGTLKEKVIWGLKETGRKSVSWAKNFALIGGIYATIECAIEKVPPLPLPLVV